MTLSDLQNFLLRSKWWWWCICP